MPIFRIHAALPGLDVPFYMHSEERPTHEQINAVWMQQHNGKGQPLKDPAKTRDLPLRDCYPGYTHVEPLKIHHIPATVGSPEEGPMVPVIAEVRVPWETIINAFVGVCETSASTYWLSSFLPLEPECSGLVASCREAKDPWYATLNFWGKGGRATLRHDDPNNDDQQTNTIIGEAEIISGLNAMANKCPKHFADLVSENDDAITHDVMIQCIVFGEIIYG